MHNIYTNSEQIQWFTGNILILDGSLLDDSCDEDVWIPLLYIYINHKEIANLLLQMGTIPNIHHVDSRPWQSIISSKSLHSLGIWEYMELNDPVSDLVFYSSLILVFQYEVQIYGNRDDVKSCISDLLQGQPVYKSIHSFGKLISTILNY